jgi:hypothetical protein
MATAAATLPHVDELSVAIDADPEATWGAILRVVEGSFASQPAAGFARLVGCADTEASGPRPLDAGSAFPGFHVEAAALHRELTLAGSHRFSNYALIFRLDDRGGGTFLRAETRAEFPGLKGSVYRGLVIGTRGHVLATRRVLAAIKRRAERDWASG